MFLGAQLGEDHQFSTGTTSTMEKKSRKNKGTRFLNGFQTPCLHEGGFFMFFGSLLRFWGCLCLGNLNSRDFGLQGENPNGDHRF